MKQVIAKHILSSRDDFEQRLSDLGLDFGVMYWQHDRVYLPRGTNTPSAPRMIVRTEMRALDKPAHYSLIFKRFIPDTQVTIINHTPVENYTEVVQMLHQLGFEKKAEISRQRQDLSMGDNVVLRLDHVEGLSKDYVKLETTLEEKERSIDVLADLHKTLEVLGAREPAPEPYYALLTSSRAVA